MFFIKYIEHPIEKKIAEKIYIDHKNNDEIMQDMDMSKSAYFRWKKRVTDSIKVAVGQNKQ